MDSNWNAWAAHWTALRRWLAGGRWSAWAAAPSADKQSCLKSHLIGNVLFKGRLTTRHDTTLSSASNISLLHVERETQNKENLKKLTSQQELWNSCVVHSSTFPLNCSVAAVTSFAFVLWSRNKEPEALTSWLNVSHRGPSLIFWLHGWKKVSVTSSWLSQVVLWLIWSPALEHSKISPPQGWWAFYLDSHQMEWD